MTTIVSAVDKSVYVFRLEDSLNLIVDNISLPIATEPALFLQILQLEKTLLLA